MLRSMTGYGRGENYSAGKKFTVEIKTVNHRFTDIFIKCPRNISFVEDKVREVLAGTLSRGKADIMISYEDNSEAKNIAVADENLAESYIKALKSLRDKFGLKDDLGVSLFAKIPDVIKIQKCEEDQEVIWNILRVALDESLKKLVQMREAEGVNLKNNLLEKLDVVSGKLEIIKSRAPVVVQDYKSKLEARLQELLDKAEMDPQRIAMEVAIFADRCSIDEELTRFDSHISQFKETLSTGDSVGRKLDFLVQEINREINTIGSKANDLVITKAVIDVKSEIEKIREQIQNIE